MPTKEEIQDLLDAVVKEYRKHKTVNLYYGVPIEDLTHDELLAVTVEMIAERDRLAQREIA